MIMKPAKETYVIIVIMFLLILLFNVLLVTEFNLTFLEFLPCLVLTSVLSVNIWISYTRKITFSQDGCEVTFLWFRKFYSWDDLRTKRYEQYTFPARLWERGSPFTHGVVFSPHRVRKSIFIKAATRGILSFFPFSHIYVYFFPKGTSELPKTAKPFYYAIDEAVFRQKMSEWRILVDEK